MVGSIKLPSIAVVAMVEPEIAEKIVPATMVMTGKPTGHAVDQGGDGIDRLERDAGVEQHLAHQHEERNRRQREAGHRLHGVARQLREPLLAAEEEDAPTTLMRRKANATDRPRPIAT